VAVTDTFPTRVAPAALPAGMGGCFAIVAPDQIAGLESLGTFRGILEPGFHCIAPWARVHKRSMRIADNKVRMETKTVDNVFVEIKISVQQMIFKEKAYEAIYRLSNPAMQIDSYVADVVRGHVPTMTLDRLFEAKQEIADEVKERLTAAMQEYGFQIIQVLVVDIEPDQRVKRAMNEINESRRLRMAAEEKAEADKLVMVKKAEAQKQLVVLQAQAEAESKFLQGEGVSRARKAIVEGMKETVAGHDRQMSAVEVKNLLLISQYMDTMEKLSQGAASKIVMPHSLAGLADVQQQIKNGLVMET